MAVLTKLTHVTRYVYDRPVLLSPQLVRLRPAPHCVVGAGCQLGWLAREGALVAPLARTSGPRLPPGRARGVCWPRVGLGLAHEGALVAPLARAVSGS